MAQAQKKSKIKESRVLSNKVSMEKGGAAAYKQLENKFATTANIYRAMSILGWDHAVMMPEGSNEDRSNQQATLGAIAHQIITSPEIEKLLDKAEKTEAKTLDKWGKSNLRLMRNEWVHNNAVPEKLLTEFSHATAECEMVWRKAKAQNDYKAYAVPLKKVIKLAREIGKLKAQALGVSVYEALIDQYDEGRRTKEIDKTFADLKKFLPDFTDKVIAKQAKKKAPVRPKGHFPIEKQKIIEEEIMKLLGFDFSRGRLDVSAHPFSGGTSDDVRITTRYSDKDYTRSLMSVFHETGHALYSFGQPKKYANQPVGNALGMSIHESQSLLIEMQVCRSMPFLKFLQKYTVEAFGDKYENKAENLYNLYNRVHRDFIRTEADEVTYPMHVILRYEIEKEIIAGNLEVEDIPHEWNKKMKDMLGLKVKTDREGCMQDIHWCHGSFGYFPSYTLGAMGAAQFYAQAKKDLPGIDKQIEKGDFKKLVNWLHENIHAQGSLYSAQELLKKVTGSELDANIFKNYLKKKYLD